MKSLFATTGILVGAIASCLSVEVQNAVAGVLVAIVVVARVYETFT